MFILIGGDDKPGKVNYFTSTHISEIKKIAPKAIIKVSPDPKLTAKLLPNADILIYTHGHPVDFKLGKNLKWVHAASAGVNDLAIELKDTNILLTNSSGVHPIPISETVLGYIICFARKLNVAIRNQIVNKSWTRNLENLRGFELIGKTVGIVGYGRIGAEIAQLTNAIGMKVIVLEHKDKISLVNKVFKVDKVRKVEQLLKVSDFVVDCLPLTEKTRAYFDMKKFKNMKKGSYFINIGRGGTVVEKDLYNALKNHIISGAALDVFEQEPLTDSSSLWKLDNIIITPHISGWTPEYTNRVIAIFCTNLKSYLAKKTMPQLVNKSEGY